MDGWLSPADRKPHFKAGFPGARLKLDFTTVTVSNDAVADDQAQAGARANRFGGEERLEDAGLDFRRNAGPIIDDFHHQLIPFDEGADADLAGPINGIDGIVDEVGPDLVEFAAMGQDARRGAVIRPDQRHVL